MVLLGPSFELPPAVVVWVAILLESQGHWISCVKLGKCLSHLLVDVRPGAALEAFEVRVNENLALCKFHHIEGCANHTGVLTQYQGPWHWDWCPGKCVQNCKLSLHRMS